jgi:hypothetical protein
LVLSAEKIVTEKEALLKGRALWTKEDYTILDNYSFDIRNLLNNFPSGLLYLHPIKLSKWYKK